MLVVSRVESRNVDEELLMLVLSPDSHFYTFATMCCEEVPRDRYLSPK